MKPLNLDNSPCTPTSSNCVIWQGPSIPCIKLCTGDTVSDVVFKLGTELCEILDALNISNYDLACLNLAGCDPKDFQALIQILIDKICELQNIPNPSPIPTKSTCPTDCVVEVAACLGGGTDFLLNYVQTIANKVCDLAGEILALQNDIDTINVTLVDLQNQINDIVSDPFTLPTVQLPNGCTIGIYTGPIPAPLPDLSQMFNQFILDWCQFRGVIGSNIALSSAVSSQCVVGTDVALQYQYSLTSPTNFIQTQYPSFDTTPATVADAIKNIWIALCDVRNAGKKLTAVVAGNNVTITSATAPVGNDEVTTYTVNANAYTTVQDEGTSLPQRSIIDFVGTGVTATDSGAKTIITIPSVPAIEDTGWQNLEGFDFYTGGAIKPQCRRIGKVIYFRGLVVIPLSNDGGPTAISYTGSTAYYTSYFKAPWTGSGGGFGNGVFLNSNGSITFNLNNNVIPTTVLPGPTLLDETYVQERYGIRVIGVSDAPTYSIGLSAYFKIFIRSDKKLVVQTIKDIEQGQGFIDYIPSSPLRFITSYTRSTDYIPNYTFPSTFIHNNSSSTTGTVENLRAPSTGYNWDLSIDAGSETDVGGFVLNLDGLTAFVS